MKRCIMILFVMMMTSELFSQQKLVYHSYLLGSESGDTILTEVYRNARQLKIVAVDDFEGVLINGVSTDYTFVDYDRDSAYIQVNYPGDESYFSAYPLHNDKVVFELKGTDEVNGYKCTKYQTVINSNTMEVWMTDKYGFDAMPAVGRGVLDGVMVRQMINGNRVTDLRYVNKDKKLKNTVIIPEKLGVRMTPRELDNVRKEKLVVRIPVFDDVQINFADIENFEGEIPFDTVIHFAYGTLVLKRLHIPELPEHYQIFADIHQRSNGDAYDRTASVFVIPEDRELSLTNALIDSIQVLPNLIDRREEIYYGIRLEDNYMPVVELVRFFTPFGVKHYNDYVSMDGMTWQDEAHYKQEITELCDRLKGDVLIGAFIGNYDGGGHKLSMDILAYPQDYSGDVSGNKAWSLPLFNTCNVMEMEGQNYGRLFLTDSLTVTFELPADVRNVRLRYISTGHGGWDNGDEFNPKENTIIIDGDVKFTYTPWRCDCATYREYNPVSGNFWNGVSSSDLSRSGWCPGTAAQPVYFDLKDLEPGKHTITIAIPQGEDEGGSFSHWMVSGILLGEKITDN